MDGGLSFRANLVANAAQFKARQAQMYREDLEKMRLRNRRENFCHYEARAAHRSPPLCRSRRPQPQHKCPDSSFAFFVLACGSRR